MESNKWKIEDAVIIGKWSVERLNEQNMIFDKLVSNTEEICLRN